MEMQPAGPRRFDGLIWAILAAVATADLAAAVFGDFQIAWRSFALPAAAVLAMALGGWFYSRRRPDPRLAMALHGTAQVVAFSAVAAPLSYVGASAGWPLQDEMLAAADRALGLDWLALLGWMNAQPRLHSIFALAYLSITVQATATVLALGFFGHYARLKTFVLAFMLAALLAIAIAAAVPAQGVWGHLGITPADHAAIAPATRDVHLAIFHGLRAGSFRQLLGVGSEGIITFPSLHTALGLIFMLALWPLPGLRWAAAGLNILLILSTPVDGGHYFVDTLAGLAIGAACWTAAARLGSRSWDARAGGAPTPVSRTAAVSGE